LKRGFPGDPEFSSENFWLLPYDYVISAVINLSKMRTRELHEYERPISVLAVQQAELNRDSKKRKRPFQLEDFYLYDVKDNKDMIDSIYGAAALKLIEMGVFPTWALFVYKQLSERAEESIPPVLLCYACDQAIVLAPQIEGGTCKGMLIAMESASMRNLDFTSPCGKSIRLRMPQIKSKIIAEENCYIDIIG
jgi:hypothetical protein